MKYEIFVLWYIARGYTPIFEWVSPDDRIVIDYGEPNLILTAIRHNNTGVYVDHDEMVEDAESNDIPCFAGRFMSGDIGALVDDIRNGEDSEGYVIRFDNGHMVKIKNEWYVTLHRSKELATNDRLIVKCILEESVDDLKPLLMESDLVRVVKMETVVNNALLEIVSSIVEHISTLGEIDRKTYAQTFSDYQFKSMVFAHHFGGKDNLLDMVRQHFLKTTTTNKKFDQEGRILLDNLA
jgi:RNA ligase